MSKCISEGGSEVLGELIAHDENIFYLPSISSVIKTESDFDKIKNCIISDAVVNYYKTHQTTLLRSKSLSKVGLLFITILITLIQISVVL